MAYEVLTELGRGDDTIVSKGFDQETGKKVAIKTLAVEWEKADPDRKDQFLREARAQANLADSHIVDVISVDKQRGWVVMEYMDGSIADELKSGPMPADRVRDARWTEVRAARAFALLNMAMMDAAVGCWEAKYFYFNPRPSALDPTIKTSIGLPNFPSYTSGHSTFSAASATVLTYLFPGEAQAFDAMKEEASISRLYACIHYRSDIEAGKDHGRRIAGYTLRFARQDGAN